MRKNKTLKIYHDQINHIQCKFDQVIAKQSTQLQVFKIFEPFIKKIFEGFNLTIFAYGQTGSGKTFTMFGSDWQNFVQKSNQAKKQVTYFNEAELDNNFTGIIPRSIYAVFKHLQNSPGKFNIFCSFIQIYNQKIYDLLQDSPTPKPLCIHQSKTNGIFVQGLTQFQVEHFVDCLNLMRQGEKNRFIRQTSMNAKSSRSHTIFQILVESNNGNSSGAYWKARLNLCDLAGSEKINKSQNMASDHLQQLKNINLSLTTLGKVIYSLSSGKKDNVAAFRESKLTRLLQQSLTSNTNTFIIGNISPSQKNLDETLNTLKFAQRASHITMKIKPIQFNQLNPDSVTKLKKQIQYLKGLLSLKRKGLDDQQYNKELAHLQGKSQKVRYEAITPVQFQKLLLQNKHMKKQIYELQNDLEKVRGSTSSNITQRSHTSSKVNSSTQFQSNDQLRREIYLQKFLKEKGSKATGIMLMHENRQSRNPSLLISAGKASIDHQIFENQNRNIKKKQKINILKKFEKMQSNKKHNDSLIIQELENLHNSMSNKRKIFKKGPNILNQDKINADLIPKRHHQANVFRKGKMSQQKSMFDQDAKKNEENGPKKKKVDYSQKIKQLQNRLYNK